MKRYEPETYALAADIIATFNLPKNASKGPMSSSLEGAGLLFAGELEEFVTECELVLAGEHDRVDAALSELADVGACLVGLREALIKLRGSNE